jgi:hypothetical protein
MRHPTLSLLVAPSRSFAGALSLRLADGDRDGAGIRPALSLSIFLAGDRVTVALEADQILALVAVAFAREMRDGIAQKDPAGFVDRWMSVVAEMDSQ